MAAIEISPLPLPAEHVLSQLAAGQIELETPLRWLGTLREEPAYLPWDTDSSWNFRAGSPWRAVFRGMQKER